ADLELLVGVHAHAAEADVDRLLVLREELEARGAAVDRRLDAAELTALVLGSDLRAEARLGAAGRFSGQGIENTLREVLLLGHRARSQLVLRAPPPQHLKVHQEKKRDPLRRVIPLPRPTPARGELRRQAPRSETSGPRRTLRHLRSSGARSRRPR